MATLASLFCFWFGFDNKHEEAKSLAIQEAQTWLELIDQGEYERSWEESALYFQRAVTKQKWLQIMNSTRNPLGEKITRAVKSKQYLTSLPGALDGEYVVIQFQTSFSHKQSTIETVTPMMDQDGKWRVSGYYIN